ncbi:hypothetical protein O181_061492 [Austropuccinia psidii MF-1]|uniref:Uncharacterized protein n=1 Tax=Austropuccinia psidii MF-1 TaxID=1389203 RepID=A0A9Q3EQJ0_9BASI|nr:hypothetical protein [Austropuccinia psidii MF-1]
MEEYPSINKGLEQKKDPEFKILLKHISNKYGKQGTMLYKKKKDTISKEDHPSVPKMNKPPRIKVIIPKIVSKIKRKNKNSIQCKFQCSGKGPTSPKQLFMEEEINNKRNSKFINVKYEETSKEKESEMKLSKGLPSETQSEVNINNANREWNDKDLSEDSVEEKIKRNRKREAMNFKLKIYDLEGKEPREKASTSNILAENHHVGIDNSLKRF